MGKKIGVCTIHSTFNYGALLQAYATVQYLNSIGHNVELVNYVNKYIDDQLKISYKQDGKAIGYLKTFIRNVFFGRLKYAGMALKNVDQLCPYSSIKYRDIKEFENAKYDILVSGSDQVWNPNVTGEFDPFFFLLRGQAKKRVSIASSLGSYKIKEKDIPFLQEALSNYDYISVREKFAKDQLQQFVKKEIKILMDPTFLLDKNFWINNFAIKSKYSNKTQPYILTYFAGGNKEKHRKIIREYKEKTGLPVWTIQYSNYTWKESSKKILGASIEDFVALIANADLVITDSFHGTAFSLNLERNFISLTNENPVRVRAILSLINIENRIDMSVDDYCEVNYNIVSDILNIYRDDSRKWVMDAINR